MISATAIRGRTMHLQVDIGHTLQGTRTVRPGGTSGQPKDGQDRGEHKVGHGELLLVLVHLIEEPVDGDYEDAVEHGQDTGGHEELAIAAQIARNINGSLSCSIRLADLL